MVCAVSVPALPFLLDLDHDVGLLEAPFSSVSSSTYSRSLSLYYSSLSRSLEDCDVDVTDTSCFESLGCVYVSPCSHFVPRRMRLQLRALAKLATEQLHWEDFLVSSRRQRRSRACRLRRQVRRRSRCFSVFPSIVPDGLVCFDSGLVCSDSSFPNLAPLCCLCLGFLQCFFALNDVSMRVLLGLMVERFLA